MKMNMTKGLLVLVGSVALLVTGCSTTGNQGATGNDTQYGAGSGGSPPPVNTGADGSVSRTNPFGIENGSGITH
jgi:hypothetical protein